MDWLFEGRLSIYVILGGAAIVFLFAWWQTRKRWLLVGVVIALCLVGLYALLDRAVETDREQIVRKIQTLFAALNARNVDAAFENVSDQFRSPKGKTKQELREMARTYVGQGMVTHFDVWDIVFLDDPSKFTGKGRASFQVKSHGPAAEGLWAVCDATFEYDPALGWLLRSVRLLKPQTTEDWEWQP